MNKITDMVMDHIEKIEKLFGPKDRDFYLNSIIFENTKENRPPQILHDKNDDYIANIRINDNGHWKWQLAHECIHLWTFSKREEVICLEEGIAVWYQQKQEMVKFDNKKYQKVYDLVAKNMPDLQDIIKFTRTNKRFHEITEEDLVNGGIARKEAKKLTRKFYDPTTNNNHTS